jgi:hypothetical protein
MVRIVALLVVLVLAVPNVAVAAPTGDPKTSPVVKAEAPEAPSPIPAAEMKTPEEPGFRSWAYWQLGGDGTSRSEVFRNLGLLAVAIIGLLVGTWRAITAFIQARAAYRQATAATNQAEAAIEQARIAEQGLFTDRFSAAVEQLGSTQLPVRLGGIYALWRLAGDSPERDVVSVIDILCAFVRNPPHAHADSMRPDVQAILNLIFAKKARYRDHLPPGYLLDLTHANLTNAALTGANLTGADLAYANLAQSSLWGANLTHVKLTNANLCHVFLADANLRDANLRDANLRDADLTDACLTDADLRGAGLEEAVNLTQSQIDSAYFIPASPPKIPPGLKLPEPHEDLKAEPNSESPKD